MCFIVGKPQSGSWLNIKLVIFLFSCLLHHSPAELVQPSAELLVPASAELLVHPAAE